MAQPRAAPSPGGKRALICDRDDTLLLIMRHLLEKMGFVVSMAVNATTGLKLIREEQPQLVIWELNKTPEIDFHMLQDVQQQTERPYVILLSTPITLTDDAPIEALSSGDVFIKPFEPADLLRRIRWLMKREKIA